MNTLNEFIIENILMQSGITINDLVAFSSTSCYYRFVILTNNKIWKKQFEKKWPQILQNNTSNITNYYEEFLIISDIKKRMFELLKMMTFQESTCINSWIDLMKSSKRTYTYTVYFLRQIINSNQKIDVPETVSLRVPGNETTKYYARFAMQYLNQWKLKKKYRNFICKEKLIEKGLWIIIQWCLPFQEISFKSFVQALDDIVTAVIRKTCEKYSNHQIGNIHENYLKSWKNSNQFSTYWSKNECKQLIESGLQSVFCCSDFSDNFLYLKLKNFRLREHQGKFYVRNILIAIVARRIGLKCQFNDSDELLVVLNNADYYFCISYDDLCYRNFTPMRYRNSTFLSTKEIMKRLINFVNQEAPFGDWDNESKNKLTDLIKEEAVDYNVKNKDFKLVVNAIYSDVYSKNKQVHNELIEVQQISEVVNPKFSLGNCVIKKTHNWSTGVVCGWDIQYKYSKEWTCSFEVLEFAKTEQYFYKIIWSNDHKEYVPEELLEKTNQYHKPNFKILGKYFSHVHQHTCRLIPNEKVIEEFLNELKAKNDNKNQINIKP